MEPSIERIEARVWSSAAGRDSGALRLAIPRFRHTFDGVRFDHGPRTDRDTGEAAPRHRRRTGLNPWGSGSWVRHPRRSGRPAPPDRPAVQA